MHLNCPLKRTTQVEMSNWVFYFWKAAQRPSCCSKCHGMSYLHQPMTQWIHSPGWFYVKSPWTVTEISKCVLSCHHSQPWRRTKDRILFTTGPAALNDSSSSLQNHTSGFMAWVTLFHCFPFYTVTSHPHCYWSKPWKNAVQKAT